ncbi:hypothetical protein ACG1BZ_15475 [Microbulbifer sp. CNSA002]|uniref:hypothetical protein n=1 Tax=unclassified Microbulbifer TaxID=2619833 RepID=UPI0039B6C930
MNSISQFRFEGDRSIPSWVNEALSPLLCGQEVYFSTVIAGGEQLKNVKINAFLDEFCVSHKEILLRPSIYLVKLEKQLDGLWLKKSSSIIHKDKNVIYVDSPGWLLSIEQNLISEVVCTDKAYKLEGIRCYEIIESIKNFVD